MDTSRTETFDELRRRLGGRRLTASADVVEAQRLLTYLRDAGCHVRRSDDVICAVASLADEEEIAAVRCHEGVAVSHASDGSWLLFRDDEPLPKLPGSRLNAKLSPLAGDHTC